MKLLPPAGVLKDTRVSAGGVEGVDCSLIIVVLFSYVCAGKVLRVELFLREAAVAPGLRTAR